jgi:hypothetical protein
MNPDEEFLLSVKKYIEESETQLEAEYGEHRSLETMIRRGIMPPLYAETIRRLESLKRDSSMMVRVDLVPGPSFVASRQIVFGRADDEPKRHDQGHSSR